MECPKCHAVLTLSLGSPVSPYLNMYVCPNCHWGALKCGDTTCDGYLVPHETGRAEAVRYDCVKCSWTGTGIRMPAHIRGITVKPA